MVVIPIGVLMAGVLLQLVLGGVLSRHAKGWLAFGTGLAAMVAVIALAPQVVAGHALDQTLWDWDQGIRLSYHFDGLGVLFALMATGIGSAILFYCIDYMGHEAVGTTRFYALMLTFIAGLVNLVTSANLLLVYLSWEIIGLCSYFLVGFWYRQRAATDGARKVLVMTHLPGYALLIGIFILHGRTGSFLWTDPQISAAFGTEVFLLFLVAAMAKSVMFPLHTWIPEAMNAPTPVSALLHSACYVKAGIYLLARVYSLAPAWPQSWRLIVLAIGCITMLVGALFALTQTDLKRLLAYSTISQLGHMVICLGLSTTAGVTAGLFYCFSHGLFKGTLFLCAGAVQHATGTRDLRRLGGLARLMPRTATIWLVATAAIIGVPLGNGFVAKWLLFNAALSDGQIVVVLVAWLVSVMTAFYMLKATVTVFFGNLPEWLSSKKVHEATPTMLAGMGVLAAACIVFGVAPQLLMNSVVVPAAQALGFVPQSAVSWLGLQAGSGLQMSAGALLAIVAVLLAVGVYRLARPQQVAGVPAFSGGDPLPAGDGVDAVDFAEFAESSFAPLYQATDPDPLYRRLWLGLSRSACALSDWLTPFTQRQPLLTVLVLAIVTSAAVWLAR
jgi:multicomponent K+:H+ antiporter subunit A